MATSSRLATLLADLQYLIEQPPTPQTLTALDEVMLDLPEQVYLHYGGVVHKLRARDRLTYKELAAACGLPDNSRLRMANADRRYSDMLGIDRLDFRRT